jgi:multicomponent Na+:H+ antiporter subunit E
MTRSRNPYAPYIILFTCLFIFWLILSPSLTALNIIFGLFSSLLVTFLTGRILDQGMDANITPAFFVRFPGFVLTVLWEIVKANIDVAKVIIDPALPIAPRLFRIRTRLNGDVPRSFYAAFINLTPGTAVVDIQGDVFTIQGLAARHEESFESDAMEQTVAKLFGQTLPDIKYTVEPVK